MELWPEWRAMTRRQNAVGCGYDVPTAGTAPERFGNPVPATGKIFRKRRAIGMTLPGSRY